MSDIVTNAEVEDVLSSIRRLVGDNKRPPEEAEPAPVADRFVLTPQLRVSQQDVLLLQPENAVSPAEDWYEFEEPPLPEPFSDAETQAHREAEEEENGTNPVEAAEFEGDADIVAADETPEDEFVVLSEEQMIDPEEARSDAEELEPAPSDAAPAQVNSKRQDFFELSAKIAALETAIAKTADQWEPDGAGRDPYAGTQSPAMKWQDDVELDGTGKPLRLAMNEEPVSETPEPTQTQIAEDTLEEQIIDEEMLRELVAEIVRSELQGDLGERITRNVRKLVRREIHRALVAQSLD